MAGIRSWLETNKIFFEIFAAIGLGAASIILTMQSLQKQDFANQVARVSLEPVFEFSIRRSTIDGRQVVEIVTKNAGGPIEVVHAFCYMTLQIREAGGAGGDRTLHVPFGSPFGDIPAYMDMTGESKGEIGLCEGEWSADTNDSNLTWWLQDVGIRMGPLTGGQAFIEPQYYVSLGFITALQERQDRLYEVSAYRQQLPPWRLLPVAEREKRLALINDRNSTVIWNRGVDREAVAADLAQRLMTAPPDPSATPYMLR